MDIRVLDNEIDNHYQNISIYKYNQRKIEKNYLDDAPNNNKLKEFAITFTGVNLFFYLTNVGGMRPVDAMDFILKELVFLTTSFASVLLTNKFVKQDTPDLDEILMKYYDYKEKEKQERSEIKQLVENAAKNKVYSKNYRMSL